MSARCVAAARAAVLESFRWEQGHSDLWRVLRHPAALALVVRALAAPFRQSSVTAVIGIEARGFLLAGAVAVELEVGFVAVRKAGALFPGPKVRRTTGVDYRANQHQLSMRCDDLGAEVIGLSVIVDDLCERPRDHLPAVHALLTSDQLPNSAESQRH